MPTIDENRTFTAIPPQFAIRCAFSLCQRRSLEKRRRLEGGHQGGREKHRIGKGIDRSSDWTRLGMKVFPAISQEEMRY